MSRLRRLALSLFAAGAGLAVASLPAEACGGLFCSRTPVDQAGEKILFATDGTNVTAYVQIQYSGDAQNFSWIVPVPTEPVVTLGSDALFTALRNTTRPSFNIAVTDSGTCEQSPFLGGAVTTGTAVSAAAGAATSDGVQVVQQQQLGAYDIVTLKADDPDALKKWLTANDYVLPDKLDPLLAPYVAGKYDFVAVKLQKNASVGDIQPIVMKYKSTKPAIPIRLTGIAATPDMDVYVWVMGQHRAIPENYKHAIINEARIDWMNYAPTALNDHRYRETVTAAMGEAGGQAFVTDYAGKSAGVDVSAFDPTQYTDLDALSKTTDPFTYVKQVSADTYFNNANTNGSTTPGFFGGGVIANNGGGLIADAANGSTSAVSPDPDANVYIPVNAQSVAFFKRFIPVPASVTAQGVSDMDFYSYLGRYKAELAQSQTPFDPVAATQALKDQVVTPDQDIQTLFKTNPYLTALYTTMSPADMTQDPTFLFNPDLPNVSNVHNATGVRQCSADTYEFQAPVQITLSNGLKYTVSPLVGSNGNNVVAVGSGSPTPTASSAPIVMPAADRIEQLKSTGLASLIQDNRDIIAQLLGIVKGSTVAVGGTTFGFDAGGNLVASTPKKAATTASGFGCSGCSPASAAANKQGVNETGSYALVVMGFLGYRSYRRRRPRKH